MVVENFLSSSEACAIKCFRMVKIVGTAVVAADLQF